MSKRARSARRLASLLAVSSQTFVRVYYDRQVRRYRVVWDRGPEVAEMHGYAVKAQKDGEVLELDISKLLWDRGSR
jgi:hypothetical protein